MPNMRIFWCVRVQQANGAGSRTHEVTSIDYKNSFIVLELLVGGEVVYPAHAIEYMEVSDRIERPDAAQP